MTVTLTWYLLIACFIVIHSVELKSETKLDLFEVFSANALLSGQIEAEHFVNSDLQK